LKIEENGSECLKKSFFHQEDVLVKLNLPTK